MPRSTSTDTQKYPIPSIPTHHPSLSQSKKEEPQKRFFFLVRCSHSASGAPIEIQNAESTHSGYDEYRYNISDIGHDPYAQLAKEVDGIGERTKAKPAPCR